MKQSPFFFIHIPKTAGTSFRKAAEELFPATEIILNYGKESAITHIELKERLISGNSAYWLREQLLDQSFTFYTGHTKLQDALGVFPFTDILTFIRNPFDQVLSHYNHHKRWNGLNLSFENFIVSNRFSNVQSRHLKSTIPANFIGFLGLTERYEKSLTIINSFYGLSLTNLNHNVNDQKEVETLTPKQRQLVRNHNNADLRLFKFVSNLLEIRDGITIAGHEWVYGGYEKSLKNQIKGAAYWARSDKPVCIDVFFNDSLIKQVKTKDLTPSLLVSRPPRDGFVGFECDLPKNATLKDIKLKVAETGQLLLPYHKI